MQLSKPKPLLHQQKGKGGITLLIQTGIHSNMNNQLDTLIIGGGLSGLTIAHKLQQNAPRHRFLILEKEGRTGGAVQSHHEQGFITEIGPHGFLDNCPESRQILMETGLESETVKAPLIDFVRYVYLNSRLNLIPQTPAKILLAPLIPLSAKLRILGDLFKPPLAGEPTVAKWINYRFGPALLPFVDAVFTGTYAGDYDKLTIDSVMPGVRFLEKEYGSVIRGLLKKRKKMPTAKKEGFPDACNDQFSNRHGPAPGEIDRAALSGRKPPSQCRGNGSQTWRKRLASGYP